jgi:hypothetical protein
MHDARFDRADTDYARRASEQLMAQSEERRKMKRMAFVGLGAEYAERLRSAASAALERGDFVKVFDGSYKLDVTAAVPGLAERRTLPVHFSDMDVDVMFRQMIGALPDVNIYLVQAHPKDVRCLRTRARFHEAVSRAFRLWRPRTLRLCVWFRRGSA